MPNRLLQMRKHQKVWDLNVEREAARAYARGRYGLNSIPIALEHGYRVWRMKGIMRLPGPRKYIRELMFQRLTKEVKERETKELMDKLEIGKTKTKRVKRATDNNT